MLRRRIPPVPRPRRQFQAAKRMSIRPAVLRALGEVPRAEAVKADPLTQLFIGAAATMLVGWLVASRLRSRERR
jgi:hypothetical protein